MFNDFRIKRLPFHYYFIGSITVQLSLTKDQWPPNSLNINPTGYHVWGAMLEAYCKLKTKPKTIAELEEALQVIWGNMSRGSIDKLID